MITRIMMIMMSKMNLFDGERCLMTGRLEHSRGGISTSRLLPSGVCFHQETGSIKKQLSSGDCFHQETVFTGRLLPSGDFFIKTGSIGQLVPSRQVPSVRVLPRQVLSGPSINTVPWESLQQDSSMGEASIANQFHALGEDPPRRVPSVRVLPK